MIGSCFSSHSVILLHLLIFFHFLFFLFFFCYFFYFFLYFFFFFIFFFFFFQAEDGIRDVAVTGVQTCALPISRRAAPRRSPAPPSGSMPATRKPSGLRKSAPTATSSSAGCGAASPKIGRASCRERV